MHVFRVCVCMHARILCVCVCVRVFVCVCVWSVLAELFARIGNQI